MCVDLCYLYCYVYLTLIMYCTVQACVCGSVLYVLLCLLNINIVLYCTGNVCVDLCYLYCCYVYLTLILYCTVQACVCGSVLSVLLCLLNKHGWMDPPAHYTDRSRIFFNQKKIIYNTMRPIISCNRKTT